MAPYELLEILLAQAIPRTDVKNLAKACLQGTSLGGLVSRKPRELMELPGIGPHAASLLALCHRIHLELVRETESTRLVCTDPADLVPWFRSRIGLAEHEQFAAVFLDQSGVILGREEFGAGSRTRTVLYPRLLFSAALRLKATGLVLAHNHPGGSLVPSVADRELTARIVQAGLPLEVSLVDHLIVTRSGYVSFRQQGWL